MAENVPLRAAAAVGVAADGPPAPGNATVDWDLFDSNDYFAHNYSELRHDDEDIIEIVTDFFAASGAPGGRAQAIDVGTGANLYPALTMLPFAVEVTLYEHARSNRRWLRRQLSAPAGSWQQFWYAMSARSLIHKDLDDPFLALRERTTVVPGNIFDLAPATYDMGTMFFVAESITTSEDEFIRATWSFVRSLIPGAPFAAAFMRDSSGYEVGGRRFPSCSVEEDDVRRCLASTAHDVTVQVVDSRDLRSGYDGMIVATGRAGAIPASTGGG